MGAILGDVLACVDGRWRVVLSATDFPVTDRREASAAWQRPPTFGPGSQPYRKPVDPLNPHVRKVPGPWQMK